jgi:hypothetical protein
MGLPQKRLDPDQEPNDESCEDEEKRSHWARY